jgi:hypothetical protein
MEIRIRIILIKHNSRRTRALIKMLARNNFSKIIYFAIAVATPELFSFFAQEELCRFEELELELFIWILRRGLFNSILVIGRTPLPDQLPFGNKSPRTLPLIYKFARF